MSKKDIWKNIGNLIKDKKIDLLITVLIGLMFYSSNLFKNVEITKLWFELVEKVISWPIVILIIILKFHIPIIGLISKISKLKIGGNELIFFETLAKIEEDFSAIHLNNSNVTEDSTVQSENYKLLAYMEPKMAILQSWIEYETLLRDKFNELIAQNRINYSERNKFRNVREMMFQLFDNKLIDQHLYMHSKELDRLRNMIVHGEDVDVSTEMALEYNKILGKLKQYISEI